MAKDKLFRFDTSCYTVLKQLLTEKCVWGAEYPALRLQLSQILPLHLYMEILSREGEIRLFKHSIFTAFYEAPADRLLVIIIVISGMKHRAGGASVLPVL